MVVLAWMAGETECITQICKSFATADHYLNTYRGAEKSFYTCFIDGILVNDQEEVTTDTSNNTKSNEEVTMVFYDYEHTVKFIPNSLFDTFKNLEYLFISYGNGLATIKPNFFKDAHKLKNLKIHYNVIRQIGANSFAEAKNLEHINLEGSPIETIHYEAFNGLPNLQGIYLPENHIKYMHPKTFSSIAKLNILNLDGGKSCVDNTFLDANEKFSVIEKKVSQNCTFELLPKEKLTAQKLVDDENHNLEQTINKFVNIVLSNDKVSKVIAEVQGNQERFEEVIKQFEQMKTVMRSQEDRVKELTDQQKELTKRLQNCSL